MTASYVSFVLNQFISALSETVQALLELHDETKSCLAVGLVDRCHLDKHAPLYISVEEWRLNVSMCTL